MAVANDSATEPTATPRTTDLSSLKKQPPMPLITAPSSGNRTIHSSATSLNESMPLSSVLQEIRLVRVHGLLEAVEADDDSQAHGSFGGGHGDDEEGEKLARVVLRHPAVERDQREVDRVEHDLDRHELD